MKRQTRGINTEKGVALIMMILILVMGALFAMTAFPLLSQGVITGADYLQNIQAHAIAIGAKEWYLQQLSFDSDWSDNTDLSNIPLGMGAFDIDIISAAQSQLSFIATGRATGYNNQAVQKKVSITVEMLPKAAAFALYWGRDTGSMFRIRNSTSVIGDFWSRGDTQIQSSSSVSGISY
jgi:type II secretory pathway component PulK